MTLDADEQGGAAPIWYTASGERADYVHWKGRRRNWCFAIASIPWGLSAYGLYKLHLEVGEIAAMAIEAVAFFWILALGWLADRIDDALPKNFPRRLTSEEFNRLMERRLRR